MAKSFISRTWVKVVAILALLAVIVLVGTPFLLQQLFKDWLLENGGDRVVVQDIDFNPFMGTLQLKGISVHVNNERTLAYDSASLDLEWWPLFEKRVVVQSVTLRGLRMRVDNSDDLMLILGGIRINKGTGEAPDSTSETAPAEWATSVQSLALEDIDLVYKDRNIDITTTIDSLVLHDLTQWSPNTPATLKIEGSVGKAPLTLDAQLLPYATQPSFKGKLMVEGFSLATLSAYVKDVFSEFSGALTVKVDFDILQDGERLEVQHAGDIALDDLVLTSPDDKVRHKSLSWKGHGKTEVGLASAALSSRIQGKLVAGKLNVENTAPPVEVTYDTLTWNGSLAVDTVGEVLQLEVRADTLIEGFDFTARTRKLRLGSFDSLKVTGMVLDGIDKVSIDRVAISDLRVGQQGMDSKGKSRPAAAQVAVLQIDKISYADNVLAIDTIDEQSIVSTMVRGKDGKLNMVRLIDLINHLSEPGDAQSSGSDQVAKAPPGSTSTSAEGESLQIDIRQLKATGDSKIHFIDQSVKPEFSMTLDFQKAEFNNISTAKPQQATTLALEASMGKYTTFKADGAIKPFLKVPEIDLKAMVKAMDLYPLTPYTHDSLGLNLKSGTLDTDIDIKTVKQALEGKIVLKLHQFEVESVDVEGSLQSQIPMPLNVALDTLRDKNNIIRLEIPVKGDPNSPDFSFNDALRQAISKGVSKGALTYLSYTLQPYGALISIVKFAGEEASRVRLKPTQFVPGESALDETDRDYLVKVAQIMHDRPKIAIKLCGVSVASDLAFFRAQQVDEKGQEKDQQGAAEETAAPASSEPTAEEKKYLEELAAKRAATVKDYLVQEQQADASHLVGCQPELELDNAEEQPRTDFLI